MIFEVIESVTNSQQYSYSDLTSHDNDKPVKLNPDNYRYEIEVNSLDQLLEIAKYYDCPVIIYNEIDQDPAKKQIYISGKDPVLELYNSLREPFQPKCKKCGRKIEKGDFLQAINDDELAHLECLKREDRWDD